MLMVIFGAGASYDSAPSYLSKSHHAKGSHVENSRPPLAAELFENRPEFAMAMEKFPECLPIIPELRDRQDVTVEAVLERLQKEAESYLEGKCQLAAIRYYLHFMLWQCEERWEAIHRGVTNHKTFLDRIHRRLGKLKKICLVTFNYDRMIEKALLSLGIKIANLDQYVESNTYKLIKLHGSVDWGRRVKDLPDVPLDNLPVAQIPSELIRNAHRLQISKEYKMVSTCPMGRAGDHAVFPALAIPVEKKKDFECPDNHLIALKESIPETTKIIVIGWRATEKPFLELLRDGLKPGIPIMIVNGSEQSTRQTLENMQDGGVKCNLRNLIPFNSGFTQLILDGQLEAFLK